MRPAAEASGHEQSIERTGAAALCVSILAAVGALIASFCLGALLAGPQLLWAVLGVVALVLGIRSIRNVHRSGRGAAAVTVAILAPVASFGILLGIAA